MVLQPYTASWRSGWPVGDPGRQTSCSRRGGRTGTPRVGGRASRQESEEKERAGATAMRPESAPQETVPRPGVWGGRAGVAAGDGTARLAVVARENISAQMEPGPFVAALSSRLARGAKGKNGTYQYTGAAGGLAYA